MTSLRQRNILAAIETIEIAEEYEIPKREYIDAANAFDLSDKAFIKIFRVNQNMAECIIDKLYPFITESSRSSSLSTETKVWKFGNSLCNVLSLFIISVNIDFEFSSIYG